MQLRDEMPSIVPPGCWGIFGGHLDPGEAPKLTLGRQLLEGQDMVWVSAEDFLAGSIWGTHLGSHRPLADGLLELMQRVATQSR